MLDLLRSTVGDGTLIFFAGIDNARFRRQVAPGDQLILDVAIDRIKAGIHKFTARASVAGELACEAQLMCTMRKVA